MPRSAYTLEGEDAGLPDRLHLSGRKSGSDFESFGITWVPNLPRITEQGKRSTCKFVLILLLPALFINARLDVMGHLHEAADLGETFHLGILIE